jgi:uncharacterized protein (TIGR00369 family)
MISVLDEFISLLDRQPKPACVQLTPFVVAAANPANGFVRLEFAEQPAFRNHFGNIQGGFAVAMLDVVLSVAAYAKARVWLPTIEIKCSFLEPLPIGSCIGEGHVIKSGKNVAFIEGRLLVADGKPGAIATATVLVPTSKA